jgi:multiple sugar transport system permease protein
MLAPALVLLGALAVVPVLVAAAMSFERVILVFGEARFVGLANYRFLVSDARFLDALLRTLYFTVVAVALELALGLPLALALDGVRRGRGLLRVAALLPWAMPTAVSARLWAWLLEPGGGLVQRLWPGDFPNLLGAPGLALHTAIVVDAWKTTPFVALVLLAGLQGIPGELREAAALDGASRVRTFLRITLPLLRPAIGVAVLFRALDAFRVFDVIFVLTEGGPANTTETLSIYAYKTLARAGDFGYGATLSVATFAAAALLAAVLLRLGRGREAP